MIRHGTRLRALAARWCGATTMQRIVDPAIADLQHEPSLSNYVAVLKVILLCAGREVMMVGPDWTLDDRRILLRTLVATALVTLIVTLALEAPFLPFGWRRGIADYRLALYLAPQALALAITVGVTLGMLFGRQGRSFSRPVRSYLLGVAVIVSILSFINLGWVLPAANQAFLIAVSREPGIMRGPPEMTFGELWRPTSPDSAFNLHVRLAFACSPLIFTVFSLAIARWRAKHWTAGIVAVSAFVGYYMLLYGGRSLVLAGEIPPSMAAWLPNVTVVFVTLLLTGSSRRRLPSDVS